MGHCLRQRFVDTRKVSNSMICERHWYNQRSNSVAADETQQNRNSTASAEAKSTLRRVAESPNSYPPLKSVAENLCFILDNCEVWPPFCIFDPQSLQSF